MHSTDEVWIAAVEEAAIALRDFGHGGALGFWSGFSLPRIGVLVAIALASRHRYFTRIKDSSQKLD